MKFLKKIFSKWSPKDVIAIFVLACCFALISQGINSLVSGITIMVVTYYFRKRVEDIK